MADPAEKAASAFRTIGELSRETGLPQHILRYWETRFPQLRPLQRAGKRRYYRPDDVALVRRIDAMLNQEGYTIRGVQRALAGRSAPVAPASLASTSAHPAAIAAAGTPDLAPIRRVRDSLAAALREG